MLSRKSSGFSIFELSLALLITAMIIISTITAINFGTEQGKVEITNERIQTIQQSIIVFLTKNGRLPCPASQSESMSSKTFGVESTIGSNPMRCLSTSSNGITLASVSTINRYHGAAPVRTLGLSNEYMIDGWGNRISYIVQDSLINNKTTNTSCIASSNINPYSLSNLCFANQPSYTGLIIKDANNNIISNAAYVLISHGPNGLGAYRQSADYNPSTNTNGPNADRNPISNNGLESINLDIPTNNITYIQNAPLPGFDDIVKFKTRNILLLECNLYGNTACLKNHQMSFR